MNQGYFLGSSGKNGFFSCFSQLTPKIDGQYTFIIKGGPGTGKSSIMKKIASEIENMDIECERIFCSSDPSSLDGIIIPSLRISIADGTSPHTIDPDYPGATGEIVNLGDCWNKELLFDNKEKIIELTDKNRACHQRSRRFIESAFSIFGDGEKICRDCLDNGRIIRYASRLAKRHFKKPDGKIGLEKIRLLDAITPKGYLFLSDTVNTMCDTKIVFDDCFGVASTVIIDRLRAYALASGYSVISSPSVCRDGAIRHIIIKELSLGFFTADKLCDLEIEPTRTVLLRRFYSSDELLSHRTRLSFSVKASKELLHEAVCALKIAKDIHDELEAIYIRAMDFEKTDKITKALTERIRQSDWYPDEL